MTTETKTATKPGKTPVITALRIRFDAVGSSSKDLRGLRRNRPARLLRKSRLRHESEDSIEESLAIGYSRFTK